MYHLCVFNKSHDGMPGSRDAPNVRSFSWRRGSPRNDEKPGSALASELKQPGRRQARPAIFTGIAHVHQHTT